MKRTLIGEISNTVIREERKREREIRKSSLHERVYSKREREGVREGERGRDREGRREGEGEGEMRKVEWNGDRRMKKEVRKKRKERRARKREGGREGGGREEGGEGAGGEVRHSLLPLPIQTFSSLFFDLPISLSLSLSHPIPPSH